MNSISKLTIFALLIVYSCICFAVLYPLLSILTRSPEFMAFGLLFSLVFIIVTSFSSSLVTQKWKGVFSRISHDEVAQTWLFLHSLLTFTVGRILTYITLFSSVIPMFVTDLAESFPTNFMLSWMILLFSIISLHFLHLIVGMGYRWFGQGTTLGIQSFSSVALKFLRKEERKGIVYMQKALLLLKKLLKHEELEITELNNTMKATRCFLHFKCDTPYDALCKLALELKKFPLMEHLPEALSTFNKNLNVKWTEKLKETERSKRTALELIVVIAAVLSGLTFLPETTRNVLFEILRSVGSAENIQVAMGFLLVIAVAYILSLVGSYYLSPFGARDFEPDIKME